MQRSLFCLGDDKMEIEKNISNSNICNICPRNCNALREIETGKGFCKMGLMPKIARAEPHMWEEPCISGKKGSGTIFFSGCVLSCVFCQNHKISLDKYGKTISIDELIDHIKRLEQLGVHNINLVSPTPYIESIIKCFEKYKPSVPIVYNTGGYEKAETIKRLEGIVDIYLPDIKYINSDISKKYSGAENYFEYASKALKEMVRQTGKPIFDDDGIMQKGTIVRHLILPQNTKNSIDVLEWLDKEFNEKILISLMGQYVPIKNDNEYHELNRRITKREYNKVLEYLENLNLDGFAQELSSANKDYIPDFDIKNL